MWIAIVVDNLRKRAQLRLSRIMFRVGARGFVTPRLINKRRLQDPNCENKTQTSVITVSLIEQP